MVVNTLELFCSSLKSELLQTQSFININEGDENILISFPILSISIFVRSAHLSSLCVCVGVCVDVSLFAFPFNREIVSTYM